MLWDADPLFAESLGVEMTILSRHPDRLGVPVRVDHEYGQRGERSRYTEPDGTEAWGPWSLPPQGGG